MPLLASPHKQALRQLLSTNGVASVAEIEAATGMDRATAEDALRNLQQTGLVSPMTSTPGLGGPRWTLTRHGHEVGWTLVEDEPDALGDDGEPTDPAEGWGFPWKSTPPEEPLYAEPTTRRGRRQAARSNHPVLRDAPRTPRRRLGVLALAGTTTVLGAYWLQSTMRSVDVDVLGLDDGVYLQPESIEGRQITFRFDGGRPGTADLELDGFPVSGVQRFGKDLVWVVPSLTEGEHTVTVSVERDLWGTATRSVDFVVDGTEPDLGLPEVLDPVAIDEPLVITGEAEDGVTVVIDGEPTVTENGTFTIELDEAPARPIPVLAIDQAGNTTQFDLHVPVIYPGAAGVHVSAAAWADDGLRTAIIELIDDGKITAVQLDLKDERGIIGYDSEIPLAREIGAVGANYDLREAIDDLHSRGVRVIGRLVAFNDPVLVNAAWENGDADWIIQNSGGTPLAKRAQRFSNFMHPAVRDYNLAVAREAAEAGIDDILWDYIRRPEGSLEQMIIPGLDGDPADHIVTFLAEAHAFLRDHHVFQGVSVFGIAATRGEYIAQDIPAMAPHVDYVAPMLYPSHWADGEYGVSSPERQPYDIIYASLQDFQRVLADTSTPLVPWLQDFNSRVDYGPSEVRAQIDAAADLGIDDFLLWDPTVTYTADGLVPLTPR